MENTWWGLSKTQLISELDNNHWDGHTKVAYGNGLTTDTHYDKQGNIHSIQTTNTLTLDYQYDVKGNISQLNQHSTPQQNNTQNTLKLSYQYDAFNRLSQADVNNTANNTNKNANSTQYQYRYDNVGNRTLKKVTQNNQANTQTHIQTLQYSPQGKGNRLIKLNDQTIEYNPQGSPLNQPTKQGQQTYRYNNQQRPITLYINGQIKADYTYNGFGERIKKTVYKTINNQQTSTTTYYLYDGRKLTAEINEQGEVTTQYVYYNNQAVVKLEKNNTYYIHNDHLGTPKAVTNKNQQIVWQATYSPFGQVQITKQTIKLNLRFPGQYHDTESNTYYNYFRDYNPQTGRYLTSDPIGLQGGINTYAYVGGNPVLFNDTLGLETVGEWVLSPQITSFDFQINDFKWVNGKPFVNVNVTGKANIGFGVSCEDTCTGEKWNKGKLNLAISASATTDIPLPLCTPVLKLVTAPIKSPWAKSRYYNQLVWSCRVGVAIKAHEAYTKTVPYIRSELVKKAEPIISKLIKDGASAICKLFDR